MGKQKRNEKLAGERRELNVKGGRKPEECVKW